MTNKKKYLRPELRVVDLSFNQDMLGKCHSYANTYPQKVTPPEDPCTVTGCMNP